MLKIKESLREDIEKITLNKNEIYCFELYNNIKCFYKIIKEKYYTNYQIFFNCITNLIIHLEILRNFNEKEKFFVDIIYDNLNYILENMKENWDLSNETINNRVEFLFNQLKEENETINN